MAGAVQCSSLIRVEQEDKQVIQQQKDQHENHHKTNFSESDLTEFKCCDTYYEKPQKHPGIVGNHAGKSK